MTSKFEQLIEYVINDEEAKAKELFHDIVVEKSREIYENLMSEDEQEELDEADIEEAEDDAEELDESDEELMNDVDMEEQGMQEESDAEFDDAAEEDGEDLTHDIESDHDAGEGDIEDRVVDLEDKLDELMAEFESLMGGEAGEEEHSDEVVDIDGGDALDMDDTETAEFSDDQMMENVTLDKVPAPKHGDDGANNKSVVAFNSGAKGMQGSPVKMTGDTAQGRSAPKSGDLPQAGQFKNVPGKGGSNSKLSAAPRPVTAQASGVNTKSPVGKA